MKNLISIDKKGTSTMRKEVLHEEVDEKGNKLPKETVVVSREGEFNAEERFREAMIHIQELHKRFDQMEISFSSMFSNMDALKNQLTEKVLAIEDIVSGRNPEFEDSLRKSTHKPVVLSKSQTTLYGEPVTDQLFDIVKQSLGADFAGFLKPNKGLKSSLFTILVPERLSGSEFDFRSTTVYDFSVDTDVKKWCERVKSNLFKYYASTNRGVPTFLIRP